MEGDVKSLFADTLPSKFENHVKTAGGEILLIEWSATKLIDDTGQLVTIIAIGQNISKS